MKKIKSVVGVMGGVKVISKKLFSNLIILSLIVQTSIGLFAFPAVTHAIGATYYVSNCDTIGNDSNNGTSTSTPWLTIAKVNSSTFQPGDSILFNKGCTWREQLTVPSSGSAGNPITFSSYGIGEKPIINGSDIIFDWTLDNLSTNESTTHTTVLEGDDITVNDEGWAPLGTHTIGLSEGHIYNNGIRFRNVNIPVGATISSAYITFVPTYDIWTNPKIKFSGEKTISPAIFNNYTDFSTRSANLTDSSVSWTIPYKVGGTAFNTPDLKDVITEIISLPDWESGNNLSIFMMDDGSTTAGYNYIDMAYKPVLNITVTTNSTDLWSKTALSPVNQLFINNTHASLSRWPSVGWQNIDANSTDFISLKSNLLTQADNYWVGSRAVVRDSNWDIADRAITASSQSANTIFWTTPTGAYPTSGYGFYIENNPYMISTAGQWAYSSSGGKIYLKVAPGTTPADYTIEASTRNSGIYSDGKSYITIDGLEIQKTNSYGIDLRNGNNPLVENCSVTKANGGVSVYGTPNTYNYAEVNNNIITDSYKQGGISITTVGHSTITNNILTDIVSDLVSPKWAMGIAVSGTPTTISNNTLLRISGHGIYIAPGTDGVVSFNSIKQAVMAVTDNGGIYIDGGNHSSLIISNNIINTINPNNTGILYPDDGNGIYLDNGSENVSVLNNLVYGIGGNGIFLHNSFSNNVYNNTVYGASNAQILLVENTIDQMHDNLIKNNILVANDSGAFSYKGSRNSGSTGFMETLDSNLYYHTSGSNPIKYTQNGSTVDYSLINWKTFSGMDANSISSDPLFTSPGSDFTFTSISPAIDTGANLGDTYKLGLNPNSVWPSNVNILDQTLNGLGWEMGAYVYSNPLSSAKAITVFDFNAISPAVVGSVNEGAKTVTLTVPYGTSLTNLVPTITHTGASVSPASGATHTFVNGVSTNYTVTATDASTQIYAVTVNVAAQDTYTLSITSTNGTVAKSPDQVSYNSGSSVSLTATANSGYSFSSWSGDASGSTNPLTVTMDGNKSITANFTANTPTHSSSGGGSYITKTIVDPVVVTMVTPPTATTLVLNRTLYLKSKGENVKALQTYLKDKGYSISVIDGIFGPQTKSAVIKFQTTNKLFPDGIVGPKTREFITTTNTTTINTSDSSKYTFSKDLKLGSTNNDTTEVYQLQKYLNSHGYVISDTGLYSPSNENQFFGQLVKKALIKFQTANSLVPDGVFGTKTRDVMNK